MKLTEKIAYMKGLLDGMELDGSTKEGKAILMISEELPERSRASCRNTKSPFSGR